jgi:glycopeptide antibiotics resistance protein
MPDISFDIPAAPVVLPALIIAVTMAVAWLQHQGRLTPARLATVVATSLYGAALVAVTLFPFRVGLGRFSNLVPWYDKVNLIPIVTIDPIGFGLNIAMTVPLGLLVPLLVRIRTAGAAALVGLAVSATIELTQGVGNILLSGGRTADVNDVIANTVGTVLGWLLLQRLTRSRRIGATLDRPSAETVSGR